jgi:hypothetical protein
MNRRRSHRYGLRRGECPGVPGGTTSPRTRRQPRRSHTATPPTAPTRAAHAIPGKDRQDPPSQPRATTLTRRRGLVGAEWSVGWA